MHSTSFALKTDIMINTTQTINQLQPEQKAQTKILSLPYRFCIHKLTYYVFVMLNVYILLSVCII